MLTRKQAVQMFKREVIPGTLRDQNARYQAWFAFLKWLQDDRLVPERSGDWSVPRICNAYWR